MKRITPYIVLFFFNIISSQENLLLNKINSLNGLNSDLVYSISQDLKDNIWISTDNGITKFNGTDFKTFNVEDGLPSNDIFNSQIDSKNRVWITGYYKGLYYIKDNLVFNIKQASNFSNLVYCFEKNDTLYFRKSHKNESFFLTPKGSFHRYKIENNNISLLSYDKKTNCFVGFKYTSGEYFIIDKEMKIVKKIPKNYNFHHNLFYNHNLFYKTTLKPNPFQILKKIPDSLFSFQSNKNFNFIKGSISLNKIEDNKYSIFFKNRIGFVYKKGVYSVELSQVLNKLNLPPESINTVFIDSFNNFWIVDIKNNLTFFNYYRFKAKVMSNIELFNSKEVFIKKSCLIKNEMFFITNENFFGVFNLKTKKTRIIKKFDFEIKDFHFGKQINIIAQNLIYLYTINDNKLIFIKSMPCSNYRNSMIYNDNLYFVGGNRINDLNNNFHVFKSTEIRLNTITNLENNFIVSNEELIVTYNFQSKISKINSFIKGTTCIETAKNEIYVGTASSGLFVLDKNLKRKQEIKLKERIYLIKNFKNNIYIASNKSLTIYNKKNESFKFYNKINFDDISLSGKVINILFNKGGLLLVTEQGIVEIKEDYINSIPKGDIEIVDLLSEENSIIRNKIKNVKRNNNNITLITSIKTFDNIDCFNSFFKLVRNNNKTNWKLLTQKNILFEDLTYGDYTLEVYCVAKSYPEVKSYKKIKFSIEAYFWETTWFKILSIIVLMFLIVIFMFLFKRNLVNRNNLKLQLINLELKALKSQMSPHFLFNALNNLQSILFLKSEEQANKYFIKFSKLLRATLEITSNNTTSLDAELKYIYAYIEFEQIRSNNLINVEYKIQEDIDLKEIEIPVMIIQPIVENAIMHGLNPSKKDKNLIIEIKKDYNYIRIIVEDNGVGRKNVSKNNHKSFASSIITERFNILNKLTKNKYFFEIFDLVKNDQAIGTKVVVSILLTFNQK